ncbi:ATPase (PilT family) [Methanonatronarchaeum thermophilum]|uniref:ATPase (PilT family) n=1 Tax=Methanonatronarchaeum thermophilum TaxID=1927129 RepID=A0A1Y3GCZ9_9EURY|nr:PINc/VapC family ATPase [Methanonatronarchaeum thermophilum]OUJ19117.1 ATPase (PilT family) [Methanonatronarchaeum thermophilum]
MKKIVPDTSVVIDGRVTKIIEDEELGDFDEIEVIISEAVVGELESQANKGQEIGLNGIEEIQKLRKLQDTGVIKLTFKGARPNLEQIKLASGGEIDYLIRDLAIEENAMLLTSDVVQAEIGRVKGLEVKYLQPETEDTETDIRLIDYFNSMDNVMSVHIKQGTKVKGKVGVPGEMKMKVIDDQIMTANKVQKLSREIVEKAKRSSKGFIEFDKGGATVVQLRDMRISISRPPFADGFEITAVRPITKVSLDDYRLSTELKHRLAEKQRGVLLAGAPGAGKSTLAQAIADYLLEKDYVVKTMEDPRDLQVSDEITQYTSLEGRIDLTADLLLLVRPDYTIYDEVRKTSDFKVFADMRLAGVGMIGVTHANRGIDALQRLIGRVELGMVPQVVDTVVFLDEAKIAKVYDIGFTVKVPAGMMEKDLARPVIEVKNFETDEVEYEIYTYGEQVVVMPIEESETTKPVWKMAEKQVEREIRKYVGGNVKAEIKSDDSTIVYVPENQIARLLGRGGENISMVEEDLGLSIDVRPFSEMKNKRTKNKSKEMGTHNVNVSIKSDQVVLDLGKEKSGETVDIHASDEYLLTATVGQDGTIKIRKGTAIAQQVMESINTGKKIQTT